MAYGGSESLKTRVQVASLVIDPSNARTHGPQNVVAISASLRRFGQAEPLVVQAMTRSSTPAWT